MYSGIYVWMDVRLASARKIGRILLKFSSLSLSILGRCPVNMNIVAAK
jgi:hypothetical protein